MSVTALEKIKIFQIEKHIFEIAVDKSIYGKYCQSWKQLQIYTDFYYGNKF